MNEQQIGEAAERPVLSARPRDSHRVEVMCALDLLLDVAYHDGTPADLALAAEAYTLAGYHDGAMVPTEAFGPGCWIVKKWDGSFQVMRDDDFQRVFEASA